MRILVAAAAFSSGMSGIQRHALNLVRCLLLQREVSAVHLVVAPWQRELVRTAGFSSDARLHTHIAQMGASSLGRNSWYYRELPLLARSLNVDLVHPDVSGARECLTVPLPTVVNTARFVSV